MKSATEYLWYETAQRRELVNVTETIRGIVAKSGISEGMALVSAMHITAGVFVNDNEPGLWEDIWEWLQRLAPEGPDYRHHRTGEDNGDAHLKSLLIHHQVIVPITRGSLDGHLATDLLRRVRRPAPQTSDRESHGRVASSISLYNASTRVRAHGVRRRNVRLDLMLGSCVKHRISIMRPRATQP